MKEPKPLSNADFRKELKNILPCYRWTIHLTNSARVISATGIKSSGFNRLSTIEVLRRNEGPWYEVAGYGHGTQGKVMGRSCGASLAKAIRGLQDHYASMTGKYDSLERQMAEARKQEA